MRINSIADILNSYNLLYKDAFLAYIYIFSLSCICDFIHTKVL